MATPTKFLGTLLADWYPDNYIVAVIDDLQEAERAVEALHQAGFGENEVRLFEGRHAASQIDDLEKQRGVLERAFTSVRSVASDESIIAEDYEQEARLGHHIVAVYTAEQAQVDQAYHLLRGYHAHAIEHFGRWVITDLWQEDPAHP